MNFRYEGMLSHSFDRFYMVTKIEIPKVLNLNLMLFQFDYNCSYVENIKKGTRFKIPSTIKEMFDVYGYVRQCSTSGKTSPNWLEM